MASSTTLQVAGLSSGFDWQSFIDQIMTVERAPVDRIAAEQATNTQKVNALATLGTKLTTLQTSAKALNAANLFTGRTAQLGSATSTWSAQAAANTATGSHLVNVTQLATAARRDGAANIGGGLATSDDVSGLTLATAPLATAVTAGTFTVNGAKVTVSPADSLQEVFDAIAAATGGAVTAGYDAASDTIALTGTDGAEVMLGAANDTSNFLRAMKLGNNGGDRVASAAALGSLKTGSALKNANLTTPITAVDGSGGGTFSINGVAIAYNVNTDSLNALMARINQSGAGVTAGYDATHDRMVLTNATTGDLGIAVSEDAGGLLGALGLTAGAAFARGRNAEFSIDGGETLSSTSNVLDAGAHGIAGLSLQVTSAEAQTITVGADTGSMRGAIDNFITAFNEVQTYIDTATKVSTDSKGAVTAAVLSSNREVQAWADSLRSLAFGAIAGAGTVKRLESMGIDFSPGSSSLSVVDEDKLTAALRDRPGDVAAYFQTSTTGFAAKIDAFTGRVATQNSSAQTKLNKTNSDLSDQIAAIERRLDQDRAVMESAFIQMETAQSNLKTQQAALDRAFGTSSSGNSK